MSSSKRKPLKFKALGAPQAITFQPGICDCVLKLMPTKRELRILDAGAGEGFFARKLKDPCYTNVEACDNVAEAFLCPDIPFSRYKLFEHHLRWVLSDAHMLGRITIAVAQKRPL